jgi:hypothetical protein
MEAHSATLKPVSVKNLKAATTVIDAARIIAVAADFIDRA